MRERNFEGRRKELLCEWVARYQTDILRMCRMLLRDTKLAEDAAQETFLKAYLSCDSLIDRGKAKAWLTSIAVNTCRQMRRSKWARHITGRADDDENVPIQQFPSEQVLLHIEVERLPYRQREVILLYYYQGLNVVEIARALKISQSSVSSRLERARTKLRRAWEGDKEDE